jgi:hypothetical protein
MTKLTKNEIFNEFIKNLNEHLKSEDKVLASRDAKFISEWLETPEDRLNDLWVYFCAGGYL